MFWVNAYYNNPFVIYQYTLSSIQILTCCELNCVYDWIFIWLWLHTILANGRALSYCTEKSAELPCWFIQFGRDVHCDKDVSSIRSGKRMSQQMFLCKHNILLLKTAHHNSWYLLDVLDSVCIGCHFRNIRCARDKRP